MRKVICINLEQWENIVGITKTNTISEVYFAESIEEGKEKLKKMYFDHEVIYETTNRLTFQKSCDKVILITSTVLREGNWL
jgi:hypothetical protein